MEELKTTGINAEFKFSLNKEEARAILTACKSIIVIPSLIENSPYVVQELLESELYVVTTDVGGVMDVVKDGITAFVSDKHDFVKFSNNMKVLVEDDSKRKEMGSAGYNHVSELFSYKRLVRDVGELYENLLNEKDI